MNVSTNRPFQVSSFDILALVLDGFSSDVVL
uniref:Uncharacterized protein n=1 Tax=Rhizophora mucronata TaxID=61149 RepID=A0A2P2NDH0_RHIMU